MSTHRRARPIKPPLPMQQLLRGVSLVDRCRAYPLARGTAPKMPPRKSWMRETTASSTHYSRVADEDPASCSSTPPSVTRTSLYSGTSAIPKESNRVWVGDTQPLPSPSGWLNPHPPQLHEPMSRPPGGQWDPPWDEGPTGRQTQPLVPEQDLRPTWPRSTRP